MLSRVTNSDVTDACQIFGLKLISSNLKKYEDSLTTPASDKETDGTKEK